MLHHAFKKLASYSLSCLMFCVSFYRSVPLFKCNNSSLIYDVSDVNSIIISLNSTREHKFNKQSDRFANIVRCDTQHKTQAAARLYLITVFDPAHCTINCHLCSSYMFRPLQGHHQGGTYKGIQVQQILLNMCVYRVKIIYIVN
jgi:ribosomal protein S27E